MRRGFGGGDDAVSEIVGTILLLGITVSLFGVLSAAVVDQFDRTPPPAKVDFRLDVEGNNVLLTDAWGDSLGLADTTILFLLDGNRTQVSMAAAPLSTNLTQAGSGSPLSWDLGETLKFSCDAGLACAYPGRVVDDISIRQEASNAVLFESGSIHGGGA